MTPSFRRVPARNFAEKLHESSRSFSASFRGVSLRNFTERKKKICANLREISRKVRVWKLFFAEWTRKKKKKKKKKETFFLGWSVHAWKHLKICIKSDFKVIFLKLATNGQNDKAFLLTSKVCHQGLTTFAPGLYTYIKAWTIYIKSDFFLSNLQRMDTVIRAFCWHQKFFPKELYALAPGLYTCIKSLKCV